MSKFWFKKIFIPCQLSNISMIDFGDSSWQTIGDLNSSFIKTCYLKAAGHVKNISFNDSLVNGRE